MFLKLFQKMLNIQQWKGWITIENNKTHVLLDKENKTFLIVISYKDLFFDLPKSLFHELFHVKYPNASEHIIEKITEYYLKSVWKRTILPLQYLLIVLLISLPLLLFSLSEKP